MTRRRVVFMGTPEFAVPSLEALFRAGHEIAGVFTQPDRPVGRGHKLAASPVKAKALEMGLPVFQFERVRRQEGLDQLRALAPEVCVTAAFGQILSKKLLAVPPLGTVNVHASLLPRYRGAAPINWCIAMGESKAGVTTMLTDEGVDTGDMLLSRETGILPLETAGALTERLAILGAEVLIDTLERLETLPRVPQDPLAATHQPMLTREMAEICWEKRAEEVACFVRGMNPWPCAWTQTAQGVMKIHLAKPIDMQGAPGTVLAADAKRGLIIACGQGALEILELQAPNARRMPAKAYLAGRTIALKERIDKHAEG